MAHINRTYKTRTLKHDSYNLIEKRLQRSLPERYFPFQN